MKNRGHALQRPGPPAGRAGQLRQALALNPSDVQALYKQSACWPHWARPTRRLAGYDRLLALKPGHVEALEQSRLYLVAEPAGLCAAPLPIWSGRLALDPASPLRRGRGAAPENVCRRLGGFETQQGRTDWKACARGTRVARPFMFQALADSPADLQACARIYARDLIRRRPAAPHDPACAQIAETKFAWAISPANSANRQPPS